MTPGFDTYGIKLTSVSEYARSVVGKAATPLAYRPQYREAKTLKTQVEDVARAMRSFLAGVDTPSIAATAATPRPKDFLSQHRQPDEEPLPQRPVSCLSAGRTITAV